MKRINNHIKVAFYVFFPGGGIGRYTHTLMKTMAERGGVNVEAVCTPEYKWRDTDAYRVSPILSSIKHPIPTVRRFRFLKGQFVNPYRASRYVIEEEFDVLHIVNINHLTFPLWSPLLRGSNVRVVASAHDIEREKAIISRAWEDYQLKQFYRFADALFVHSETQVEELSEFAGIEEEKVTIVPHGCYSHGSVSSRREELREKWDLPEDEHVALFFGHLRDEKNLDGLLRGMALVEDGPHLVVAGRSAARHRGADYYRDLAERLEVDDRVTFINRFIPDEEVAGLFTACDWVALPYEESFTSQSGVLNVAAHYERPLLAGPAPVLRETVGSCDLGVTCSQKQPEAMAEAIQEMEGHIDSQYKHRFDRYKERFSWEENVRRTIDVYEDLSGH